MIPQRWWQYGDHLIAIFLPTDCQILLDKRQEDQETYLNKLNYNRNLMAFAVIVVVILKIGLVDGVRNPIRLTRKNLKKFCFARADHIICITKVWITFCIKEDRKSSSKEPSLLLLQGNDSMTCSQFKGELEHRGKPWSLSKSFTETELSKLYSEKSDQSNQEVSLSWWTSSSTFFRFSSPSYSFCNLRFFGTTPRICIVASLCRPR